MEKEESNSNSVDSNKPKLFSDEEMKALSEEIQKGPTDPEDDLMDDIETKQEMPKPQQNKAPVQNPNVDVKPTESVKEMPSIPRSEMSTQPASDYYVNKEELSIEDLHNDLETKLKEQGFIFDKKKFIFNDQNLTTGERIADKVASFGGSWKFIIMFGTFIFLWIVINVFWLLNTGYDPYPFILLNLILSCLASLQAPIIMMSQNRQAEKDRKQEEINIEKEILDFKQDRLDLILDQKQWQLLQGIEARLKNIENKLISKKKPVKQKTLTKFIKKNSKKKRK